MPLPIYPFSRTIVVYVRKCLFSFFTSAINNNRQLSTFRSSYLWDAADKLKQTGRDRLSRFCCAYFFSPTLTGHILRRGLTPVRSSGKGVKRKCEAREIDVRFLPFRFIGRRRLRISSRSGRVAYFVDELVSSTVVASKQLKAAPLHWVFLLSAHAFYCFCFRCRVCQFQSGCIDRYFDHHWRSLYTDVKFRLLIAQNDSSV